MPSGASTRALCEQVPGQTFVEAGGRRDSSGHFDLSSVYDEAWLRAADGCAGVYDAQEVGICQRSTKDQ